MINKQLINLSSPATSGSGGGNQEEGLILHLDANDVDSYDGDGTEWVDIANHEYKPATNVSEHFNTLTYTGNGTTGRNMTGLGFSPDLVWIKKRSSSTNSSHMIFDTVRGTDRVIISNSTQAEYNAGGTGYLPSFDSDGFTLTGNAFVNQSGQTYVAWCFKAGGAPTATNTLTNGTMSDNSVSIDGELKTSYSITDATLYPKKISANTKLGFSTVLFTGTGDSNNKVPHGLGVAPELIIYKNIDAAKSWVVGTDGIGWSNTLKLDDTTALGDRAYFDDVTPTSNVFEIYNGQASTANDSGSDFIAYCFASKRGVSKVGSFTGTGAAGNKVYTGFEPAFILTKRSSSSGAGWTIIDNKRSTDSDKNDYLYANTSGAEATSSSGITFNRDGFTFNGSSFNTSGQQHIYYAVAKSTNETSLIDDTDLELHLDADSFPEKGESGYSNTPSTWTALTGSNATISGATFDSELGNYLDFDGSNDYVSVPHNTTLDASSDNWTFEAWVNKDVSSLLYVASKSTPTSGSYGWRLRDGGSSGYQFFAYNTSNTRTTIEIGSSDGANDTGKWHHLVFTWDGTNWKGYFNGELRDTQPMSGTMSSNTDNLEIGRDGYSDNNEWNGKIGQVRVYSSALTQDQIRQNFNYTKPSYPNGYNGTISGATWDNGIGEADTPSYFNFNGSSFINTTLDLNSNNEDGYTLSAWFRLASTPNALNAIFGDANIVFGVVGSNVTGSVATESMWLYQSSSYISTWGDSGLAAYADNEWHHIVLTVIGNSTSDKLFYVDGSPESQFHQAGQGEHWTFTDLRIGNTGISSTYNLKGDIAEVKIFNRVLTSSEIASQFNLRCGEFGLTQI